MSDSVNESIDTINQQIQAMPPVVNLGYTIVDIQSHNIASGFIGNVVIWYNLHYKNLTGNWGSAPDGDAVYWQELPNPKPSSPNLKLTVPKYICTLLRNYELKDKDIIIVDQRSNRKYCTL